MTDDLLRTAVRRLAAGHSLSADEAGGAFDVVMSGGATPVQVAALLMGLRVKGETASEVAGAARALRRAMIRLDADAPATIHRWSARSVRCCRADRLSGYCRGSSRRPRGALDPCRAPHCNDRIEQLARKSCAYSETRKCGFSTIPSTFPYGSRTAPIFTPSPTS